MEFHRVTTKDLLGTIRTALDEYCPRLLKLYRARKGAFGQEMESLLDGLDEQVDFLHHVLESTIFLTPVVSIFHIHYVHCLFCLFAFLLKVVFFHKYCLYFDLIFLST